MILGGIVAFGIFGIIGLSLLGASAASHHAIGHRSTTVSDSCHLASTDEGLAADEVTAGDWQNAYARAVAGLRINDGCHEEKSALVNRGYLMTMKAWSEHHLSSGDSVTDMNEAITLLQECQTTPGIYGTHEGAACETQEDSNIRQKQNWEMGY
jgi:hypothetical protein